MTLILWKCTYRQRPSEGQNQKPEINQPGSYGAVTRPDAPPSGPAPALRPSPQARAADPRLRAETGERVQARLTAHGQCGSLAGGDMVRHVAFAHEGANAQLLWGFLWPPQAGAAHDRRKRGTLHPHPEAAMRQPVPSPASLLFGTQNV